MRKYRYFICFLILTGVFQTSTAFYGTYPIYSPYPDKATATQLLSRNLIIEKRVISEKERQKLLKNDPDQLKFEEDYNRYYQDALQYYFENKFAGQKKITFMTPSGIDSLIKSHTNAYTIISGREEKRSFEMNGKKLYKDTYSFSFFLSEESKPDLIISFTEDLLSDADFIFLVQQASKILTDASKDLKGPDYNGLIKGFSQKIKNKKLLVSESMLNEKFTKEDIQKTYTLPIEFVKDSVYEEKIKNEEKGYVYLTGSFAPALQGYICLVVDSERGEIILALGEGSIGFNISTRPTKTQMNSMGYVNPSRTDRNRYSTTLFQTKSKFKIKKSHLNKMMDYSKD